MLKEPSWVFADEATSAIDADAEKTLYQRLLAMVDRLRGGIVSIAHRPSVAAYHNTQWAQVKQPDGAPARYALAKTT